MNDQLRDSLIRILSAIGTAAILIWIISFGVRSGMAHREGKPHKRMNPAIAPEIDAGLGPGKFKISGVDRTTKMDTVWFCVADNAANAKVKAELEGIIVTSIDRE